MIVKRHETVVNSFPIKAKPPTTNIEPKKRKSTMCEEDMLEEPMGSTPQATQQVTKPVA